MRHISQLSELAARGDYDLVVREMAQRPRADLVALCELLQYDDASLSALKHRFAVLEGVTTYKPPAVDHDLYRPIGAPTMLERLAAEREARSTQAAHSLVLGEPDSTSTLPPIDLLGDGEGGCEQTLRDYAQAQAVRLQSAFKEYGIDAQVVGMESGPVVTLYSVQPGFGVKAAKIAAAGGDIARSLKVHRVRVIANQPGKATVGIEVPNQHRETVRLIDLCRSMTARSMDLPMFLGKDASGDPLVADLARMPHMLIAGTTGSGKSVCLNAIIMSWLYAKRPDELKLVLVDPKMVELSQFGTIPHLLAPVVTETDQAAAVLEWAVKQMELRYRQLQQHGVRDIKAYNDIALIRQLPYIVIVIDELADLMMTNRETERLIARLAQKARAVGIHLVLATQRPQATVVTGLIKSNMPCRVSFRVASALDSRIVLDRKGAETLLGQGDMLFLTPESFEPVRCQGTLVTDDEVRDVVQWLSNTVQPRFDPSLADIVTTQS